MKNSLTSMVGKQIKVHRGGPESREGMLLAVNNDYLTLLNEKDGVVYYNLQHVKNFTHDSKKESDKQVELPVDFAFETGETFLDILNALRLKWVTINRGGPDKVEGVLIDVDDLWVGMVLKDEVIVLSNFHIKSISYGNNPIKTEENNDEEKDDKKGDKKGDKQDDKK